MDICEDKDQLHLDRSLDIIKDNISKIEKKCENGISDVREMSKYHWERKSEMDDIEKSLSRNDINHTAQLTNSSLSKLRLLRKAAENPYFGKIKVDFDGDSEDFYIGLTSIMDNNELIINDWRSPIATLFYNSKIGKTSYNAPVGNIDCTLLQRSQIKIKNGKIQRKIDSDIHLSDDELQEVLSKNTNGKMKNIVTTIQEEQNDIIRNLKDRNIIVQGCAGSGKTSVALHRLSYLLYNDNKSNSENMLIFSPSDTFSYYISSVLPDLGEDNVLETTFTDFANSFVNRFDKIESFCEFVSKYYDGLFDEDKNKLNKFKFSKEYKIALDRYIQKVVNSYKIKEDFEVNGVTIPVEYLNKLLEIDTTSSLQEKVEMLSESIFKILSNKVDFKKETIRSRLLRELASSKFDARVVYNKFLSSEEFKNAYGKVGNTLNKKLLEFPDLIGMLYLNFEITGYPNNDIIHHLVIDEVQDYTPLQIEMIAKMFKGATITALGDAKQTINPYHMYKSLEEMKQQFGINSKYMELNKAYRSSPEIMDYVKNILENDKLEAVRNSNNLPVLKKEIDKKEIFKNIVSDIINLKNNGFNRICIITKSTKEAKAIYEGLKDSIENIKLVSENENLDNSILVSTSYNSKGLEFDAVICYNDIDNPYNEEDKYLYYVACTRAQHELLVYNEPKVLKKGR